MILWCASGLGTNKLRTSHWSVRYKLDKKIKEEIGWAVLACGLDAWKQDPKHPRKVHIVATRYFGGRKREMDKDNLTACVKPAIDALKMNGGAWVIVDDTPEWVEVEYRQEKTDNKDAQGRIRLDVY